VFLGSWDTVLELFIEENAEGYTAVVWPANVLRHRNAIQVSFGQGLPVCTLKLARTAPSSMAIILRRSNRQVGVKVGGGAEEELLDCCLFRLKPPGFIISWRLLPRDLDSSLEKVQKLVLKPALHCWCQL